MDYKELRAQVKAQLDRNTVKQLLEYLGEPITRDYHFKQDKSFSIARNGMIKDFGGTGFCGDFVSYLCDFRGVALLEALLWTAEAVGVRYE